MAKDDEEVTILGSRLRWSQKVPCSGGDIELFRFGQV